MDLDTSTPEAAQRSVVDGLGKHAAALRDLESQGRTVSDKLTAAEKMIGELRQGQAVLRETLQTAAFQATQGDESELRSFVEPSGKVRLRGRGTDNELWTPGLLDSGKVYGEWHGRYLELVGMRSLARIASDGKSPKIDRALDHHVKSAPSAVKRIFGEDNFGQEWIPTENLVPDLDRDLRIVAEGSVMAQFATVPMSTKVITYPFGTTGGTPYVQGEPVANPAQYTAVVPGTDNRTHTAKTLAMRYEVDNDSAEDAIVDTYAEFIAQMASDLADGEEDMAVNSDSAATSQDTGLASWNPNGRWGSSVFGGSADHRRPIVGLRARAFDIASSAAVTDMGSVQTFDGLMALRGKLHARYGKASLMLCSEKWLYTKVLTMDEVQSSFSTVGQITADGRVLTIAGMPVFTSLFMTDDLNASGVYDATTMTKSAVLLVNKLRFKRYLRRGALVEIARDITRGKTDVVATWRGTFKTNDAANTRNVVCGYNLG